MADPPTAKDGTKGAKRKDAPQQNVKSSKAPKRQKTFTARQILTQASDPALKAGELDLGSFLKAREFEIKALEDGMRRAKGALTKRAFQLVPWEMRRRTASHNVKRVPKRLQKRAKREMKDDNTPTVAGPKKPKTGRGRIRAETAKRLRALAAVKKAKKGKNAEGTDTDGHDGGIIGRVARPKLKTGVLQQPQPISKFRKRQIEKTWLPTHMFHAKRATMTPPSAPLWRFALPITPQQKCYRPAHRAGWKRGALVWDMSYMSTIGMGGTAEALRRVLSAIGVVAEEKKAEKWLAGKRTWSGWVSKEVDGQRRPTSMATVIWSPEDESVKVTKVASNSPNKVSRWRRLFIRVHPAAFLEFWEEVLRVSKMQYPLVHVEDLRFEIGSMELTGPDALEALIGTLYPHDDKAEDHGKILEQLLGVTNAASLPANSLLSFNILDPRLRHPPQKLWAVDSNDHEAAFNLLESLSNWPADDIAPSTGLFDRDVRHKATRLPSQKAINRRQGAAPPGEYPKQTPLDPPIPVLLYASRTAKSASAQGTWTLIAPWKCIPTIWYSLTHFPLASGGNPRFAGLQELQQISFERGVPCFPMDYPGTRAGYLWELQERAKRKKAWDARPKGKRVAWESIDLGAGRKGELGLGWACDLANLIAKTVSEEQANEIDTEMPDASESVEVAPPRHVCPFTQLLPTEFEKLLLDGEASIRTGALTTVRITLFSRGVPQPCARVYRLPRSKPSPPSTSSSEGPPTFKSFVNPSAPTNAEIRAQWLALVPPTSKPSQSKSKPSNLPPTASMPDRVRALAQELLKEPAAEERVHPLLPGEEDLIGFVSTGNFNLAKGAGTGIASLGVERFVSGVRDAGEKWRGSKEEMLCVVRNAGEEVGRLGYWEIV